LFRPHPETDANPNPESLEDDAHGENEVGKSPNVSVAAGAGSAFFCGKVFGERYVFVTDTMPEAEARPFRARFMCCC